MLRLFYYVTAPKQRKNRNNTVFNNSIIRKKNKTKITASAGKLEKHLVPKHCLLRNSNTNEHVEIKKETLKTFIVESGKDIGYKSKHSGDESRVA